MKNAEQLLVKMGIFAGGVILAGYVMATFSDVAFIGTAKKGFGA